MWVPRWWTAPTHWWAEPTSAFHSNRPPALRPPLHRVSVACVSWLLGNFRTTGRAAQEALSHLAGLARRIYPKADIDPGGPHLMVNVTAVEHPDGMAAEGRGLSETTALAASQSPPTGRGGSSIADRFLRHAGVPASRIGCSTTANEPCSSLPRPDVAGGGPDVLVNPGPYADTLCLPPAPGSFGRSRPDSGSPRRYSPPRDF
jgi:hypothetical protein